MSELRELDREADDDADVLRVDRLLRTTWQAENARRERRERIIARVEDVLAGVVIAIVVILIAIVLGWMR